MREREKLGNIIIMAIKIKDIIGAIESFAPLAYQESYDNAGVQIGSISQDVSGILLTLDITPEVVKEAIALGYNCIIAHHPLIFSGIKRITGKNAVEQCIIMAIKHDIVLYAAHTNLDNVPNGVNKVIADKLALLNPKIMLPITVSRLCKFITYVPKDYAIPVKAALFAAGGGAIGNYSECSFATEGVGTFTPNAFAKPQFGQQLVPESIAEMKIEVVVPEHLTTKLLHAVRSVGFYEEVAYDIIRLENDNQHLGSGMIGDFAEPKSQLEFLTLLKEKFNLDAIRYTAIDHSRLISKVAVCGGSGSFLLAAAKAQGADALVTADYKYHQFFEAEEQIMIADIGHYESEQYTYEIFQTIISEQFPLIPIQNTSINTNPVQYFK